MAIEPLGTISTIQYQSYQPKQTVDTHTIEQHMVNLNSEMVDTKTRTVVKSNKSELNKDDRGRDDRKSDTSKKSSFEISEEDKEKLKKYIKEANKKLGNTKVLFKMHEETNRVSIKIVDKDTDKVIREIPPEEALDSLAKRLEVAGLFMDEKK